MPGMTREDLIKDALNDVRNLRGKPYASVDEFLADLIKVAAAVDNAPVRGRKPD